jgi:hypothetical protein
MVSERTELAGAAPNGVTLYVNAWSYLKALQLIEPSEDIEQRSHLATPIALLSGFAIELGLKSVLSVNGFTDEALRRIGHNLRSSYRAAKDCGLEVSDQPGFAFVLERLAPAHLKQTLRYMPANLESYRLPTAPTLVRVIEGLLSDITEQFVTLAAEIFGDNSQGITAV